MLLEAQKTGELVIYTIKGECPRENNFLLSIGKESFCPRMPGLLPNDNMGLVIYGSEFYTFLHNLQDFINQSVRIKDDLLELVRNE